MITVLQLLTDDYWNDLSCIKLHQLYTYNTLYIQRSCSHTHAHTLYPRLSLSHTHTRATGDFYLTRHSNLSQVHIAFHLVTDEVAVQSSSLRSRHPVVAGLKNCLRAAARHDVHHITIPLLLVHRMQPVCVCVCAQWCMHVC